MNVEIIKVVALLLVVQPLFARGVGFIIYVSFYITCLLDITGVNIFATEFQPVIWNSKKSVQETPAVTAKGPRSHVMIEREKDVVTVRYAWLPTTWTAVKVLSFRSISNILRN